MLIYCSQGMCFLSLIISFLSLQKLQRIATFAVAVFVELGGVMFH